MLRRLTPATSCAPAPLRHRLQPTLSWRDDARGTAVQPTVFRTLRHARRFRWFSELDVTLLDRVKKNFPQGSILGVHDDLSCPCTCVWSSSSGPVCASCWCDFSHCARSVRGVPVRLSKRGRTCMEQSAVTVRPAHCDRKRGRAAAAQPARPPRALAHCTNVCSLTFDRTRRGAPFFILNVLSSARVSPPHGPRRSDDPAVHGSCRYVRDLVSPLCACFTCFCGVHVRFVLFTSHHVM